MPSGVTLSLPREGGGDATRTPHPFTLPPCGGGLGRGDVRAERA
jgi:hypothetical protein